VGYGDFRRKLNGLEAGFGRLFGDRPTDHRDVLTPERIDLEHASRDVQAFIKASVPQPHLGDHQQQQRIVTGGVDRQVFSCARQIAAFDEDARQMLAERDVSWFQPRRLTQHGERLFGLPHVLELCGHLFELGARGRVLARLGVVAALQVHLQQAGTNLGVIGRKRCGFTERFDRFALTIGVDKLGGQRLEVAERGGLVIREPR
jgi:hypothetical protein